MGDFKWIFNSTLLLFYACSVMYLLLNVQFRKLSKNKKIGGLVYFSGFLLFNIMAQVFLGYQLYGKYYLLLTQLPVYVLFIIISEYRGIKLLFVLLTAVFFSSPVMLVISVIRHFIIPPIWTYVICYITFIMVIYRFFKKSFNDMLSFADNRIFLLFTAIPLLFYFYSFGLTQYQLADTVINKRYFILQIPLLIVLIAYFLLVQIFKMVSEKAELTNAQNLASAQLNAATEQIDQLRVAEKNFAIYRHDLRHHLNYLNTCILENKFKEATDYISQTFDYMDNLRVIQYSQNEPVNLILSSYVGKAKEKDIAIDVRVTATNFGRFLTTDLCSLLANALENAIKASSQTELAELRYVKLRLYDKSNKLCLELLNGYETNPRFENKIPVSQKDGHGIGVKSMIHVIEKYDGVYRFTTRDREFCFQLSM